jgi:hypothetical protein
VADVEADMFLSADDLRALTGYAKPSLQRRWLLEHGYRFDVRADGRPAVLVAQVEARQTADGSRITSRVEPNWDALR